MRRGFRVRGGRGAGVAAIGALIAMSGCHNDRSRDQVAHDLLREIGIYRAGGSEDGESSSPAERPARLGLYSILRAQFAKEEFGEPNGVDIDAGNGKGFSGSVGYRFHEHFAVEADGDWLLGFGGNGLVDVDAMVAASISAKLFAPKFGRFEPYGKLGVGRVTAALASSDLGAFRAAGFDEDDVSGSVTKFGLGVDVSLDETWFLNAELARLRPSGDVEDLETTMFGLGIGSRF